MAASNHLNHQQFAPPGHSKHGIYCERLPAARDDLRDRGEDFDGNDDPKIQHEIESQNASGFPCSCGKGK